MSAARSHGRVRGAELALLDGGSINLADFCGQKLVIFFCPSVAALAEVAAFGALADDFESAGAWLVGVADCPIEVEHAGGVHLGIGIDPDNAVFEGLRALSPNLIGDREAGAVFLVDRDGTIREAWSGAGHAADALEAALAGP